jgi:hypothetical protein
MCSCRLHRAGMRFCRVMVRAGVRFHGKLSRWTAKTMTACALAGRPKMLSWWQEIVPVDNRAK